MPHAARSLSPEQRTFLASFIDWYRQQDAPNGERIHKAIYDIATEQGLKGGQAFQVMYRAFLGRTSGPRAGELVAALDHDFALRRLQQVDNIQYLASAGFRIVERRRDAHYASTLRIHADVFEKFPELRLGIAYVAGVHVQERNEALEALKQKTAEALHTQYKGINIGSLEHIKAYRELYRMFGVDPGKRNPSTEALLRRVVNGRGLPTINSVVDSYNLASVETLIPMAAYDAACLKFPVELRFSLGDEVLEPIGGGEPITVEAGELVYADQDRIVCLDFNHRDADYTKITGATTDVLLFVDGCGVTSVEDVQGALDLATSRIVRTSGGELAFSAVIYRDI